MATSTLHLLLVFTCLISISAAATYNLCGYKADSNVRQHAKIDLDLRDIGQLLDNGKFASAKSIYRVGKNSMKTTGRRTLQGFSTDAQRKLGSEPYFKLYKSYWKNARYADKFVLTALAKNGAKIPKHASYFSEVALKGMQYQNVWMYVVHELEDAVADCKKGASRDNDGGVQAWDEGLAFYCGSSVGPTGSKDGYLLYTLAQKRCSNFGTCARKTTGKARVNIKVLNKFKVGQNQINKKLCRAACNTVSDIVTIINIPLVQGCIRYIAKTKEAREAKPFTKTSLDKLHAEGWAFCAAIIPQVSRCSMPAANLIIRNLGQFASPPMKDSVNAVANAVYKVLGCLGIKCADVGNLKWDTSIGNKYHPAACKTAAPRRRNNVRRC